MRLSRQTDITTNKLSTPIITASAINRFKCKIRDKSKKNKKNKLMKKEFKFAAMAVVIECDSFIVCYIT